MKEVFSVSSIGQTHYLYQTFRVVQKWRDKSNCSFLHFCCPFYHRQSNQRSMMVELQHQSFFLIPLAFQLNHHRYFQLLIIDADILLEFALDHQLSEQYRLLS